MRFGVQIALFVGLLISMGIAVRATTLLESVNPETAKAGDVVTANGSDVGSGNVSELYLTGGGTDMKVEIVEQTEKTIKFKVPAAIKPGRWTLMVNLKNQLIEMPVKLTVE